MTTCHDGVSWRSPRWSVITTPVDPEALVITVENLEARARIAAADGEPELVPGYLLAAQEQVQRDTGLVLLPETHVAWTDALPSMGALDLPVTSWPIAALQSVAWTDDTGAEHELDPGSYLVDLARRPGRLSWVGSVGGSPRTFQGWKVQLLTGWASPELVPPLLRQAIGVLASHYLTIGRDLTSIGSSVEVMPMGYEAAIAPWRVVSVA